jgi:hypothetical protein
MRQSGLDKRFHDPVQKCLEDPDSAAQENDKAGTRFIILHLSVWLVSHAHEHHPRPPFTDINPDPRLTHEVQSKTTAHCSAPVKSRTGEAYRYNRIRPSVFSQPHRMSRNLSF